MKYLIPAQDQSCYLQPPMELSIQEEPESSLEPLLESLDDNDLRRRDDESPVGQTRAVKPAATAPKGPKTANPTRPAKWNNENLENGTLFGHGAPPF